MTEVLSAPAITPNGRNCSGCGAPLLWAKFYKRGILQPNATPVDVEPVDTGNVRVVVNAAGKLEARVLSGEELAWAHDQAESLRLSHFITCPAAGQFRKGKK